MDDDKIDQFLVKTEETVEQAGRTTKRIAKNSHLVLFVAFVALVTLVGMAIISQRNNRNVDDLQRSTDEVAQTVRNLEAFVEDLEDQTPEEQARNDAITEAVRQVPEIRSILCDGFPEATECLEEN